MNPTISIIVPIYNLEKYLSACIDSLLSQTYQSIEILLVNDGSTDNSGEICDAAALKDSRIYVIHRVNGGAAMARNDALDVASGSIITFVDGDDIVSPDYVESLYEDMINNDADISCCSWQDVEEGDTPDFNITKPVDMQHWTRDMALEKLLYQEEINASMWCKMFRAPLFDGIRFPKGNLYEDLAIIYKIFSRANKVTFRDHPTYHYLLRGQGTTLTTFSKGKMDLVDVCDELLAYIEENFPHLKSAAISRLMRANFHIYLQIPRDAEFAELRKRIEKNIKKHRKTVLRDSRAKRGTKIAIAITYLGFGVLYNLKEKKNLGKK